VLGQALATTTRFALGSERAGAHLGGTRPARLGLSIAAVGLLLEAATDLAPVAALGLAVASVGAATYWPLLSAVTTRAADRPGLAVGGVSAAGYLGFLAGPPIVGAIASGAGLRAGVLALALAGAAAASIPLSAVAQRLARDVTTA
jgi:MFS family permease